MVTRTGMTRGVLAVVVGFGAGAVLAFWLALLRRRPGSAYAYAVRPVAGNGSSERDEPR